MPESKRKIKLNNEKDLLKYILFSRPWARLAIISCSCIATFLGLMSPTFQKEFVDFLTHADSTFPIFQSWQVHPLVFIFLAFLCVVSGQFFSMLSVYLGAREATVLQKELGEAMYTHTLKLRTDTLAQRPIGELVSLYATDIQSATVFLDQSIPTGAAILFPLILAPLALVYVYAVPLSMTLATMISIVVINGIMANRQSKFFSLFKKLAADRTGFVNEWIQNIRALRILGWTSAFEHKIFIKRKEETFNRIRMVTNGQLMNAMASSITFILNIIAVASLVYMSHQAVTPGQLLALLWIVGVFLVRPFRQMPWFFTFVMDGFTSVRRLGQFFQLQNKDYHFNENSLSGNAPAVPEVGAPIQVRGLNLNIQGFSILKNIDLDIKGGEFCAVVGSVGSGKSMLLLSLMGETGAQFESYKIDNRSVLQAPLLDLKKYFAFVPQEGFVISATLRENIAFEYDVKRDLDEKIHQSLAHSQFILAQERVGQGLDTEIGERGVNLSGGQKQRVSLARADFYKTPIILLDDCLSAVDVDTEKQLIHSLLNGAWKNRTRILVTHRLSILKHVSKVIFLEDGYVNDVGTLKELYKRNHKFREYTATVEAQMASVEKGHDDNELEVEVEMGIAGAAKVEMIDEER